MCFDDFVGLALNELTGFWTHNSPSVSNNLVKKVYENVYSQFFVVPQKDFLNGLDTFMKYHKDEWK